MQALAPAHEYDFENSRIIRTPSRAVYLPPHTNIPHRVHVLPPEHHRAHVPPPEHHIIVIIPRHIPTPVQAHGTAPAQAPVRTTQTIETQTQTAPYGFTIVDEKGKKY